MRQPAHRGMRLELHLDVHALVVWLCLVDSCRRRRNPSDRRVDLVQDPLTRQPQQDLPVSSGSTVDAGIDRVCEEDAVNFVDWPSELVAVTPATK